jgi:anti-sigma B factor antagonist
MEKVEFVVRHEPIPEHPDAVLVTVEGPVDPKTVNRFKADVDALVKAGRQRFVLDCKRLTYVNSSGLAYLLNLVGSLSPKDGLVALAAVDSKIMVIFNMMGITQLFRFYPSAADAIREMDVKLARQLKDVGPALPLDDVHIPVATPPPRSSSSSSSSSATQRLQRTTRRIRRVSPPPAGNPIARFFRALFGMEPDRPASGTRVRRRR